MQQISILAISSSRVGDSAYLEKALPLIEAHLGSKPLSIAFIPFADPENGYAEYVNKVTEALPGLPHSIKATLPSNARSVIEEADVIMVGGGNTFKLLHDIYDQDLFDLLKEKVSSGTPYVGWSAGANIVGPGIGTTNDMPIIEPRSFNALGLLPFQINPHYYNQVTPGFNGETRDQRLEQYVKMNPQRIVIGLPEGTALKLKDGQLAYVGHEPATIFSLEPDTGMVTRREIVDGSDLSYVLNTPVIK